MPVLIRLSNAGRNNPQQAANDHHCWRSRVSRGVAAKRTPVRTDAGPSSATQGQKCAHTHIACTSAETQHTHTRIAVKRYARCAPRTTTRTLKCARAAHQTPKAASSSPVLQRTTCIAKQPDRLNPQSQSLSQSYGSALPTSLTYIILSNQRLFTLETCCGYGYGLARKSHTLTPTGFQGPTATLRTPQEPRCFTVPASLSPGKPIPGIRPDNRCTLPKKRQLFPGLPPTSPCSFALPLLAPKRLSPCLGSGILTRFPFGKLIHVHHPASAQT